MSYPAISGAILSGGKNSRMDGRNKAFIDIKGQPILDKTVSIFKALFDEILIITNTPEEYADYEDRCGLVPDLIKHIGPLGGIHAALSATTKTAVFFVACDMPNLHNEMIESQINQFIKTKCDVLVPRINNFIEPLHAIYRTAIKEDVEQFIENSTDHSIKGFLGTVNTSFWDVGNSPGNTKIFKNLNTPEDVKEAFRWK